MFWLSQGGGSWGGGPRGGGPWGGPPRDNGGGPGPGRRGPRPPDFEELLRRGQSQFRRYLPGGFGTGSGIAIAIVAVVVIWLASGFYRVLPDEVGIVLRFGAYNRTTQPGLNYHLPSPIETALTPSVTRVNRIEIGYRSGETETGREAAAGQVPEEGLMLTGDENIVDINFTVFWVIKDAKEYLFNIRDQELTVKSAAESAMREIVGETPIAQALSEGRAKVEADTSSLLQSILDSYGAGIAVTQLQLQRVDPPAEVIELVPRRSGGTRRSGAPAQRGRGLSQQHRPGGARRRGADRAAGGGLPAGDGCPRPGRRRPLPLGLPRLQDLAGRHPPTALPRDHGGGAEEQPQGHHRQIGGRSRRGAALSAVAGVGRRQSRRGRRGDAAAVDGRGEPAATGRRRPAIGRSMGRRALFSAAAALIVIGILAMSALFIVSQTEQALLLQFGKPIRVVTEPGLRIKQPFIQNVMIYDKRLLDFEPPPEEVIASDQKRLIVDTYARYRITDPLLFYQTVGSEAIVRARLGALVSGSLRQVIGSVTLSALLSPQRAPIMRQIRDEVAGQAKPLGIDVVDVRIRRADLPPQNSEAIYARMRSERQQQAALFRGQGTQAAKTVRANADRERTVILADAQRDAQKVRGDGDAKTIQIYAEAYGQDQKFFAFYRSLQAYRDALNGNTTSFVLNPSNSFFRFFENPGGAATEAGPPAAARPTAK